MESFIRLWVSFRKRSTVYVLCACVFLRFRCLSKHKARVNRHPTSLYKLIKVASSRQTNTCLLIWGMSLGAKIALGASVTFTASIITYVHYKQVSDKQVRFMKYIHFTAVYHWLPAADLSLITGSVDSILTHAYPRVRTPTLAMCDSTSDTCISDVCTQIPGTQY